MTINADGIVFKVDTKELDDAVNKVSELADATKKMAVDVNNSVNSIESLSKKTLELTKQEIQSLRNRAALAKARAEEARELEREAKALVAMQKEQDVAAKASDKLAEAKERVSQASEEEVKSLSTAERMVQKQTIAMQILRGETVQVGEEFVRFSSGLSKSQANQLANMQLAGGTAEQMKIMVKSFEDYNRVTGVNTFDKSASALEKMKKEMQELSAVNKVSSLGYDLTKEQIVGLVREGERLVQQMQSEYGTTITLDKAISNLAPEYIKVAASVNHLRAESQKMEDQAKASANAEIKAARDKASAMEYVEREMNRVNEAVSKAKEGISTGMSNQLIKFEQALHKSGVAADVAEKQLEAYKNQLMLVQKASGQRAADHLSRALGPQITDITVGLATGQSLMTVLLQQGGQVRDQIAMFNVEASQTGAVLRKAAADMVGSIFNTGIGIFQGLAGAVKDAGVGVKNMFVNGAKNAGLFAASLTMSKDRFQEFKAATLEGNTAMGAFVNNLGSSSVATFAFTAGVVGVTAAIAALLFAYNRATKEQEDYNRVFALHNASIISTQSVLTSYTASQNKLADSTNKTSDFIAGLGNNAALLPSQILPAYKSFQALSEVMKITSKEVIDSYEAIAKDPVDGLLKLQAETGRVNERTIEYVRTLYDAGDSSTAVKIATEEMGRVHTSVSAKMLSEMNVFKLAALGIVSIFDKIIDGLDSALNRMLGFNQIKKDAEDLIRIRERMKEIAPKGFKSFAHGPTGEYTDLLLEEQKIVLRQAKREQEERDKQLKAQRGRWGQEMQSMMDKQDPKSLKIQASKGKLTQQEYLDARWNIDFKDAEKYAYFRNNTEFARQQDEKYKKEYEEATKSASNKAKSQAEAAMKFQDAAKLFRDKWFGIDEGFDKSYANAKHDLEKYKKLYSKEEYDKILQAIENSQPKVKAQKEGENQIEQLRAKTKAYSDEVAIETENYIKQTDALYMLTDAKDKYLAKVERENALAAVNREYDNKAADIVKNAKGDSALVQLNENERQREIAKKQTNAKFDFSETQKVMDKFNSFVSDSKISDFGSSIASSFGEAASAMGSMFDALVNLTKATDAYSEARVKANDDPKKLAKLENDYFGVQMKGYADVSKSVQTFFGKKTALGKAAHAMEMGFTAVRIAMQIKEVGVQLWADSQKVASSFMSTMAQMSDAIGLSSVLATLGVINQAQGDPYSAPIRMAAMAAIMAGLGFAVFGGGTSGSFAAENKGTGTVLGDKSKASESITKALESLSDIGTTTNRYSAQMAASLKNIESNISGLASLLVRSGDIENSASGISTGFKMSSYGSTIDNSFNSMSKIMSTTLLDKTTGGLLSGVTNTIGKLVGGLFGTSTKIKGQGIFGSNQSIESIINNGFQAQYYDDIQTKKKTLGITTSTSNKTIYADASSELEQQFTKIITDTADSIRVAGKVIGMTNDQITQSLNSFVVSIGKINTQGKTGTEIQDLLTNIFSANADKMAQAVAPGFEKLQKVGEGYYETLVRVATTLEQANTALDLASVKMYDISKDGAIAASNLVDGFGTISDFVSAMSDYSNNFFTEEEIISKTTSQLDKVFKSLGITMPKTRDEYKKLVESQDLTTEAGQAMFTTLINLSSIFSDITKPAEEAATKLKDFTKTIIEYVDSLSNATGSSNGSYQYARAVFGEQVALVKSGNSDAMDNITSYADKLLEAAKANAKSSLEYDTILAQVKAELLGLTTGTYASTTLTGASLGATATNTSTATQVIEQTVTTQELLTKILSKLSEMDDSDRTEAAVLIPRVTDMAKVIKRAENVNSINVTVTT